MKKLKNTPKLASKSIGKKKPVANKNPLLTDGGLTKSSEYIRGQIIILSAGNPSIALAIANETNEFFKAFYFTKNFPKAN